MHFDFQKLAPAQRYKLLIGFVVPRPIALVTTRSKAGLDNAAPFSFFNVFSENPALVMLGLGERPDGTPKDTTANINETGEFVVNLVDESIAKRMALAAIEFPADESEIDPAGFTLAPSTEINVGRIAEAPASLECRKYQAIEVGDKNRMLMIGEVIHFHARDGLVDPETHYINEETYKPIGRLHRALYTKTADRFEMPLMTYEEWCAKKAEEGG
jgi:flavin reductase (DIM6/NTAB) family NADH-FMN oxidoreductase RutF